MTDWLEHSVQVEVPASVDTVWGLWSDLEKMPLWMRWIESVAVSAEDPEISRWRMSAGTFNFSWNSKIIRVIPNQIIQWESIDGLPNRGAIRFYDRKQSSIIKLTVAYGIPGMVGQLMDSLFLGNLVESNLQADLHRFRDYVVNTSAPEE